MTELFTAVPVLLGITGKKRHGKGTFGKVAQERGFIEINFADQLRALVGKLNPIVHYPTDSDGMTPWRYNDVIRKFGYEMAKNYFPEVVRMLQVFGSEVIREADPEFWVQAWKRRYLSCHTTTEQGKVLWRPVVVTDVRFDNEAKAIQDLGGVVIRVIRPDFVFDTELNKHQSENGVCPDLVDLTITSDTVEILCKAAGDFLDGLPQLKNPISATTVAQPTK